MDGPDLVCRFVHPASGCNCPEMYTLTICYIFESLTILYFLIYHLRTRKRSPTKFFDWFLCFWLTTLIWSLYHSVVTTFYFDWTLISYLLADLTLDSTLLMCSLSFVSLITSETLFNYQRPTPEKLQFSRIVYLLAISIFLTLGIACATADVGMKSSFGFLIYLWKFLTNVVMGFFIDAPSIFLLRAMTYPIAQPSDRSCIRSSIFLLTFGTVLFSVRAVYDLLAFFGSNPIDLWFEREVGKADPKNLSVSIRVFNVLYDLIFNFGCSFVSIVGIAALRHHEVAFDDDDFYIDRRDEGKGFGIGIEELLGMSRNQF
jgi:hypothetical protein